MVDDGGSGEILPSTETTPPHSNFDHQTPTSDNNADIPSANNQCSSLAGLEIPVISNEDILKNEHDSVQDVIPPTNNGTHASVSSETAANHYFQDEENQSEMKSLPKLLSDILTNCSLQDNEGQVTEPNSGYTGPIVLNHEPFRCRSPIDSPDDNTPPTFKSLPSSFQYSPSLNCLISISAQSGIEILDIHSRHITTHADIPPLEGRHTLPPGLCKFLDDEEKLVVSSGNRIGCRSTNGEQIFLNTILQVAEVPSNGLVTVELDIVKAGLLLNGLEQCLRTTDPSTTAPNNTSISNKSKCQQVALALKFAYEKAVSKMKDVSGQSIKWLNVCFTMEHSILMSVFNTALLLCKQDKRGPALPVIGDILQRLTAMQKSTFESICSEKRLMFNEVDRLQTFNSWPHMNYKWALPGPMAEAGFYHPHSSTKSAEDRAMCFTCSVCLVCWESSDQPWSEHKRHAHICPFVKGEHTENVPLQVYTATAGAQKLSRDNDNIVCMGNNSCDNLLAVGTDEGYIVIWEIFPVLKVHSEYQISVSAMKDSYSKQRPSKSKDLPLEEKDPKLPEALKDIAAKKASTSPESPASGLESTLTAKDSDDLTPTSENLTPTKPVADSKTMTDVVVDGESYCVIVDPVDGSKPNTSPASTPPSTHSTKSPAHPTDGNKMDVKIPHVDIPEVEPKLPPPTSKPSSKTKVKNVERSCRITSVTLMKDEKTCEKFIIAGVKIESRKIRKSKEVLKYKLALLIYKLAGKVKVKNDSADPHLGGIWQSGSPYLNNPFAPMGAHTYEDDFSIGSDDDYGIYDDVNMDHNQLAVIDEYLLASQKNSIHHHSANGGTQNIALSGNEIKTGFDQEEIVKIEDVKTVYEDCTFHKFDIDRSFYTKDMYISDLIVVDGFLVTVLKQESNKKVSETEKFQVRDFLLVSLVTSNKKQVINFQLVAQRQFESDSLIQDLTTVPCRNLPSNLLSNFTALHQYKNTETNSPYANLMPKTLVLLGLSDNSLMFLSVPQLIKLKMPSNIVEGRSIHKITYCNTLSSVAICDNEGYLEVCPCLTNQDQPFEMTVDEISSSVSQWNSQLTCDELKLLSDLTKFEPVTQGCYIFFPVNWYVTRTGGNKSSQASPVPNHMLRLSPVEMDKRLMKRTEQLDIELSKTDFTFRMFVLVQTSVGYFDILVNLKTPLKDNNDFTCSFYIDESRKVNCQGSDMSESGNNERLICGPILFSSVVMSNKLSGQFTIIVPELINKKSLYVIVKLECVQPPVKEEPVSADSQKLSNGSQNDFLMTNILKDVYVGVYQFKRLASNAFYFPGCRNTVISDEVFQENLIDQYLDLVSTNGDIRDGFEIKIILDLLVWITSVHLYSTLKDNLPLVSIISRKLPLFLKASLLYGDRSMCHACCQILLGLKRCTTDEMFCKLLEEELWNLLPHIHQAVSSAAYHWAFLLLCDVMGSHQSVQRSLIKLTSMLMDVGDAYGESFSETQKVLDARYGLSDMVFEPFMIEPLSLTMKCGSTFSPNSNKVFDLIRISSDHVPGILEAQPLHFSCLAASDGSKVEVLGSKMSSATAKTHGCSNSGGTIPMAGPIVGVVPSGSMAQLPQESYMSSPPVEVVGETFVPESMEEKAIKLLIDSANQPEFTIHHNLPFSNSKKDVPPDSVATSNQLEELAIPDESVIPKQMCMIIDKMHVYSVHYVILDFKTPVFLSDLIFPPLKALASITISVWGPGQNPEEAQVITHSDRISKKALIFSNMVTPVHFQYMKIVFVGTESCSAIIPLGQFFGYTIKELSSPNQTVEHYDKEYESISCRYAVTADRIKMFPIRLDASSKYTSRLNDVMLSTLKRDYLQCAHLRLSLNFLRNNPAWTCVNNLLAVKDLDQDLEKLPKLSEKSFSLQRLLLSCLLDSIVFHASSLNKKDGNASLNSTNFITKEGFLSLFKRLCIYGAASITELSTSVLFMLCGKSPWWSEALVDIFQYCFCEETVVPLPRRRLFNVVMKLIHSTEDINQVVENFLLLLQQHVKTMMSTDNKTANVSMLNSMYDYILLLLTQILESKDNNTWNFFTPWEYLPEVMNNSSAQTVANFTFGNNQSSGLNKWFQQVSGSTVAEKMNNLQKAMMVEGAGPKKVSGMKVWYPPKLDSKQSQTSSSTSSPTSSVRVSSPSSPSCKIETDIISDIMDSTDGIDVAQKVFISKQIVNTTLKSLMEFVISKLENGNPEQLILACKVCSLIVFNSRELTSLDGILNEQQIRRLFSVCMAPDSNHWLVHTINLLLKSFVNQKRLSTDGTPTESDLLGDAVCDISSPKSKSDQKCPGGSKKSDQDVVTSKAEQFNKMYYESMKNKFYEVTEGHHSKTNPPQGKSATEGASIKKELEAMLSASECKVLHPVRKDFNRILESTLLSLQRSVHKRRPVLRSNNERKQMMHISDVEKYFSDLNEMQSATIQYLLTILMDMIKENIQCDILTMQQLVYLLNLAKSCDAKLNATTYVKLSQTIVFLFQSPLFFNESYSSLKKQMMDFVLRTNAEAALQAQFNLLLLQSSDILPCDVAQPNSVMLFKDLMIRDNLQDMERLLVKKLLVKQINCERNSTEDTELIDILKGIEKSGLFLLFSEGEEVTVTYQIADAIACKLKRFIDKNVVLLQSCQHERSDSKRTVFSLYNGRMRLTGKSHTTENDVTECIHLLDLLKRIIGSNALHDVPQEKKLDMITKMIRSLCKCCKLVTENKCAKSASLLMSGFNVRVPPASTVHPLASAINSVLMEVYVNDFWELLVIALVEVLRKEQLTDVCGSTADGFRVFILTLLKSSERVWALWVEKGGFDVICQSVISNCAENMCWTDSLNHSTVIQDLYCSSIAAASQKLLDRDRVVKDHSGTVLENFAPYAKIYGPATSAGADVLLVNKSPLRRSRFAAWAHQFQQTDDPWIELTIVLPFEVRLHEVIIYMHGNYLIGAPSQAILELKGLSDSFVAASPAVQTGGLGSIVFHLAEGQICKELRFRLRRPFDGDHIKLNLIEVFGSTIFEVMENESSIPIRRKLTVEQWIDILLQLLDEIPSALNAFCSYKDFSKLLSALIGNIPYVCSLCLHRLSSLFILKLLPNSPDFTYKVTEDISSRMLHDSYLNHFNSSQLQLVIQLLADLIVKSEEQEQIRIFRYLLDWICEFLLSVNEDKCAIVNDAIRLMVSKIFSLLKEKDSTHFSLSDKLKTAMKDLLLEEKTPENVLIQYSRLLNLLVSIDSSIFTSYYVEANKMLQEKESFVNDRKTMGSLVAVIACYDSGTDQIKTQCNEFMNKLSSLLCSTIDIVDKSASFSGNDSLKLLCWIVSTFSYFFMCDSKISKWFAQDAGRKFWEPLIRFVCKYDSIKTRCLQIFTLQSTVISIFREILYMNPQNQEHFCKILVKLLQNGQLNNNLNGYMKVLLLQLVIAEDTVIVHFRSKSDSYVLQNTHGIHVRITTSLSEIEQTLLAIRCELIGSNSKSKSEKAENTNPNHADNIPGADSDLADYVLQSGSSAVAKRKTKAKQDSSTLQKSKDQMAANLTIEFFLPEFGDDPLPKKLKFGQILQLLHSKDPNLLSSPPLLLYSLVNKSKTQSDVVTVIDHLNDTPLLCTMLGTFARQGGLPLLTTQMENEESSAGECSYIYLFSLILPLPGFARVFLEDRIKSELLLRLMLGVGETKSGQLICSLAVAQDLPVLPLKSLLHLLQETTADSEKGLELRTLAFERRVVDFILNNLRLLAHHEDSKESKSNVCMPAAAPTSSSSDVNYWAKGTGFGTGSTVSSWDIEKAMKAKKKEEEQIVVVFQVLAAFVEVRDSISSTSVQPLLLNQFNELMDLVQILFTNSCIIEVLAGYLRNDSVLDMSRHIPLYHAILALLRALASGKAMLSLLVSMKGHSTDLTGKSNTLVKLLTKLRGCVETYQSRLKLSCKTKASKSEARPVGYHLKNRLKLNKQDEEKDSKSSEMSESDIIELNLLLTDIHSTSDYVLLKVEQYEQELNATSVFKTTLSEEVDVKEKKSSDKCPDDESVEERYFNDMIGLQFDTYEIVTENDDNSLQFNVPYHYANSVRSATKNADAANAARSRRLAQEVASLSTSLPISYSSTVFLQCDEERLDVMKVLITGPEDTPYENGCFEFDIYFPPDYPSSPMLVNLQTTGKHTVRFNPNLYNDGKVCLSILNTWHGRPEERWNAQTSNLLQVLVSIQSLILVSDPYFNEPGYERLRGTAQGKQNSNDYNANIQQASVKWAMLEQIKRPSACFKQAIRKHFLLKKARIILQCEKWLVHLKEQAGKRKSALHSYEALKTHFAELKLELDKLEQQEKKRKEREEQGDEENSSAENTEVFVDEPSSVEINSPLTPSNSEDIKIDHGIDEIESILAQDEDDTYSMSNVVYL